MSLTELIAGVEDHRKVLTVFNADPGVVGRLREYFRDRNLRVEAEHTPSGKPGKFVTLSEDGEVLTATALSEFRGMLDDDPTALGLERPYRPILDRLDETMFTSWSTRQLVAASREIEDRAWRVGEGTLRAGFQYLSTLRDELPVYERLGATDIEVHVYAAPDAERPEATDVALHLEGSEEIERSWFVVFDDGSGRGGEDGAGDACALLAEEREPREFYGFWTYDRSTVEWIGDHLDSTYGPIQQ